MPSSAALRRSIAALCVAAALIGCGDDSADSPDGSVPPRDGGVDSDGQVGSAGRGGSLPDAGGRDSGPPLDAAIDASADAGPDTGVDPADDDVGMTDAGPMPAIEDLPYARAVVSFAPGAYAGFGAGKYPGNVLGPPRGMGTLAGSLDVLSLGVGGEIVLDFGERRIIDGPGADLIVFENPFWPSGVAAEVFAELGEVAVSEDGSSWHTFECDTAGAGGGTFPGCAGWSPTSMYDPFEVLPLDPELTGGDAFDLEQLGIESARYVRVRDLASSGEGMTAGFDLDAVGLVHFETAE